MPQSADPDRPRYRPSGMFRRTAAERADQEVSWRRTDEAFFASGACHILAWEFVARNPSYGVCALWRIGDQYPAHTIASDGTWAFDYDGWTLEAELIEATKTYEGGGTWELVPVTTDLATFCVEHYHRQPHQYYADPRPRARAYLDRFPAHPPTT